MRWIGVETWGLALALAFAGVAAASEPTLPAAVGRVNVQGQGFCTGTLVSPTLVVTAAHCLFNPRTGLAVRLGDVHFVAGWDRGSFIAHAQPKAVHLDPAYRWQGRHTPKGFAHDVAFLELPEAMDVPPLVFAPPLDPAADPGRPLALVHYSRSRPHLAAVSRACHVTGALDQLWRLDCPVESGASGAPVLMASPNGWQVAGIVIGRTESSTAIGSLALPLGAASAADRDMLPQP